jgi:hypothetical protein
MCLIAKNSVSHIQAQHASSASFQISKPTNLHIQTSKPSLLHIQISKLTRLQIQISKPSHLHKDTSSEHHQKSLPQEKAIIALAPVPAVRATTPGPEPTNPSQERQYPRLSDVQLDIVNTQSEAADKKDEPGMFFFFCDFAVVFL